MKNRIHIPEPCHEIWNNMIPSGNGRHCASCNKVVVDLTKMSTDEIGAYLASNKGACGNIKSIELKRPFNDWRDTLVSGYQNAKKSNGNSKKILVFFLSCILFLSSCYRHVTRGKMRASSEDTKHSSHQKL